MFFFRVLGYEVGILLEDFFYLFFNSWLVLWIVCRFLYWFKDFFLFFNVFFGFLFIIFIFLLVEIICLEFILINCKVFSWVCVFGLRKVGIFMWVVEGVLVVIFVFVIVIGVLFLWWKSWVVIELWSIVFMVGLLFDVEVRGLVWLLFGCIEGGYLRDD